MIDLLIKILSVIFLALKVYSIIHVLHKRKPVKHRLRPVNRKG